MEIDFLHEIFGALTPRTRDETEILEAAPPSFGTAEG